MKPTRGYMGLHIGADYTDEERLLLQAVTAWRARHGSLPDPWQLFRQLGYQRPGPASDPATARARFQAALVRHRRMTDHPLPCWREVLAVLKGLGYSLPNPLLHEPAFPGSH